MSGDQPDRKLGLAATIRATELGDRAAWNRDREERRVKLKAFLPAR